jgi:hypothetical protein
VFCPNGNRCRDCVIFLQAQQRDRRTSLWMIRENTEPNNGEVESIDAVMRGGSARSSVDAEEIQWSKGAELSSVSRQSTL